MSADAQTAEETTHTLPVQFGVPETGLTVLACARREGPAGAGVQALVSCPTDQGGEPVGFALCWAAGTLTTDRCAPAFVVRTDAGTFTAAAPAALDGGWHHLAGTYDGERVSLFVDGQVAAGQPAAGRILECSGPALLGRLGDSGSRFAGQVEGAAVLAVAYTPTEIRAIASAAASQRVEGTHLDLALDTYLVLAPADSLPGTVTLRMEADAACAPTGGDPLLLRLRLTPANGEPPAWEAELSLPCADGGTAAFQIPLGHCNREHAGAAAAGQEMPAGSDATEVRDSGCQRGAGQRMSAGGETAGLPGGTYHLDAEVMVAGQKMAARVPLVLRAVHRAPRPRDAGRERTLSFVRDTVGLLAEHQSAPIGGDPGAVRFLVTGRSTHRGYRSLGHKTAGRYATYWFPERPFEREARRADLDAWPVLEALADATGQEEYREWVAAMAGAFARYGFDPASGLCYTSEESDLDVPRAAPLSTNVSDLPRFKPNNGGRFSDEVMAILWEHAPAQMARCARAIFTGLVTLPETMDFNRFCMFGFDDAAGKPSLTANSAHCGFESIAARMIQWWGACYARTGDLDCREWAERMADKWLAVQHPESGLVPDFFGAEEWRPGAAQRPGRWTECRGAAAAAAFLVSAAGEFGRRPGAGTLAGQLRRMGTQMALGVARFSYDAERGVFREHLHLDGTPYHETARYTFHTEAEKAEAMRQDPSLVQVPVYAGCGFFQPGGYWEHCAGSSIPCHLARVAATTGDAGLLRHVGALARAVVAEARALDGAFTAEGRWTFHATGEYVEMLVLLARASGEQQYLGWASELAEREMAALAEVECPQWWRMRERTGFLRALLLLHRELR